MKYLIYHDLGSKRNLSVEKCFIPTRMIRVEKIDEFIIEQNGYGEFYTELYISYRSKKILIKQIYTKLRLTGKDPADTDHVLCEKAKAFHQMEEYRDTLIKVFQSIQNVSVTILNGSDYAHQVNIYNSMSFESGTYQTDNALENFLGNKIDSK